MSSRVRVTLVQFRHTGGEFLENLHLFKEAILRHRGSDLIVFPESTLHRHSLTHETPTRIRTVLRGLPPEDLASIESFIADAGARVVYGNLVEREGRLYNVATYTDGHTRVDYEKTHVHWTEPFAPGTRFPVVETPLGPTGFVICYDAAFPEVPRLLALQGARAIVNISAIPDHFPLKYVHRRLVACSIENQVFTLFANRTGLGFSGGSAVVDPRGEIIALADDEQPHLTVEIDMSEVDAWRTEEPLFPHRRPDIYTDILRT